MPGVARTQKLVWERKSILGATGPKKYPKYRMLPSLLSAQPYSNPKRQARFGSASLMPVPLGSLADGGQQKDAVTALVNAVAHRHIDPKHLVSVNEPFTKAYCAVHVTWGRPIRLPCGSIKRERSEVRRYHCMPVRKRLGGVGSRQGPGYIRLDLTGKRKGGKRCQEWAHRLLCWVFQGPPPRNAFTEYEAAHLCGNPDCLCPAHLRWMTPVGNASCRRWHAMKPAHERRQGMHLYPGPYQ